MLHPAKYFEETPAGGGYRAPTLFLITCSVGAGALAWIFGGSVADLIGYPVRATVAAILVAWIVDYARREFFEVSGTREQTYGITAGAGGLVLFAPVPLLAWPAGLYGLYIVIVGLRCVYGLSTGRAFVATALAFLCMNVLRFVLPWIVAASPFGLFSG